jgi:hypothetical protein
MPVLPDTSVIDTYGLPNDSEVDTSHLAGERMAALAKTHLSSAGSVYGTTNPKTVTPPTIFVADA